MCTPCVHALQAHGAAAYTMIPLCSAGKARRQAVNYPVGPPEEMLPIHWGSLTVPGLGNPLPCPDGVMTALPLCFTTTLPNL